MSGVVRSVVLMQTCLDAICLDAGFVRRTLAIMRVAVVVVMARVLRAVMGMRGFKGAMRHRVKGRAQQGRNSGIVMAGCVAMTEYAGITACHDDEQNGESRAYRRLIISFH
jgi:hypothetical protein